MSAFEPLVTPTSSKRALLPCVDPASRSCRDAEPCAYKTRRSSARTRTSRRAVPERRVMATTRASAVCSRVHMVRTYTWPRTETNQRTNQATNQPACAVNKDDDIATTTTRPTPNHARHATPTRPRHQRPARLEVPKTPFVCVPKTPVPFPSLHFTSSVVRSMYLLCCCFFLSLSLFLIWLLVPSPFLPFSRVFFLPRVT